MRDDRDIMGEKTVMLPATVRRKAALPVFRAQLVCENPAVLGTPAGVQIPLDGGAMTIGRGRENTVAIKADGVSRVHCRLVPGAGHWTIEDQGSTNGVLVNRQKVAQAHLGAGDLVTLGTVHYRYEVIGDQPAQAEAPEQSSKEKTQPEAPLRKASAAAAVDPTVRGARGLAEGASPARAARREAPARSGTGSGMKLLVGVVLLAILAIVAVLLLK